MGIYYMIISNLFSKVLTANFEQKNLKEEVATRVEKIE